MDIISISKQRWFSFLCMILLYMLGMTFDMQSVIGGVQWHGDQISCLRKLASTVIELMQLQYDLIIIIIIIIIIF